MVAILEDATNALTHYTVVTSEWQYVDTPVRVTAVNGVAVGQADLNTLSLPLVLLQTAPLASDLLPTEVSVSIADVAFQGASVNMTKTGTLWTTIRTSLGLPPVVESGASANMVVVTFPDTNAYSAEAFMLPANDTTGVEADIVSATFAVTVPTGTAIAGDVVLIQLAATDSSGISTRSFSNSPTDETCAFLLYTGFSWTLTTYAGYGNTPFVSTGPYFLGDSIRLSYTKDNTVPQRVNTVIIGLPPIANTGRLPTGNRLLSTVGVSVVDVETQILAAYSATGPNAYAVTFDVSNL